MDIQHLQKRLVLVEYPAIVRNPSRMQETLGGINRISDVFCTNKRLPLTFHPENIYAKPTQGDRTDGSGLLLKVVIRRPKHPKPGAPVHTKSVSIVGLVDTSYQFKGMCDFQFLPIATCPTTRKPICIYDQLVPSGVLTPSWMTAPTTAPYFLPPSTFSRLDTTTRLYRRETVKMKDDDSELIGRARVRFRKAAFYLTFNLNDPIPESPPDGISLPDMLLVKFVSVEQLNQVRDMFAQRPIMSKMYISWQTKIPNEKLKYILPLLSYYYTTGPWRIMWVRYGYDPRKDFESRYMQQLDFRVRFLVSANNAITVDRRRNTFKGRRKRETGTDATTGEPKLDYPFFDHDTMPRSRSCIIYQFCDIRVPRIQEMLDKIPTPLSGAVCSEKSGWLPANFDEQCRTIMVDIVKALAKSLRSATDKASEAGDDEVMEMGEDEYEEDDMYDDELQDDDDDEAEPHMEEDSEANMEDEVILG